MSEQHLQALRDLIGSRVSKEEGDALEWAIEQLTPKPVSEASLIAEKTVTPATIVAGFERDFANSTMRYAMYAISTDKLESMSLTFEAMDRTAKSITELGQAHLRKIATKVGYYVELNPETDRYDVMYAGQPYVSGFYHQHIAERACDKLNAKGG